MGMPAARVSDMHTCPMVEPGPVPHVGGPILKGSLTVKIGGKPAARMGDPTQCVGPPGVIAKGEPTVKIGDMGMGSAGGGAGGSEEDAGTGAVAGAEAIDVAAQIGSLKEASAEGMAFCQQCSQPPSPPPPPKAPAAEQQAESQPGAGRDGPAHGHGADPAGRPQPSARPLGRDPRARDRDAREPRGARGRPRVARLGDCEHDPTR